LALTICAAGCGGGQSYKSKIDTSYLSERLQKGCYGIDECQKLADEARLLVDETHRRLQNCKLGCGNYKKDWMNAKNILSMIEEGMADLRENARQTEYMEESKRKEAEEKAEQERKFQEHYARESAIKEAAKARIVDLQEKAQQSEYAVPVISAMICELRGFIVDEKDDIKRERQLERSSGVIDLGARRAIAERIMDHEDRIEELTKKLKLQHKARPEKCSERHQEIMSCRYQYSWIFSDEETQKIPTEMMKFDYILDQRKINQGNWCAEPTQTYADIWKYAQSSFYKED